MNDSHAGRITPQSHDKPLSGTKVLLLGTPHETREYRERLDALGATVIYSNSIKMEEDRLKDEAQIPDVIHEIEGHQPRPAAVVVFHPNIEMSICPSNHPVIQFAYGMKQIGMPLLIADDCARVAQYEIGKAGAVFCDLKHSTPERIGQLVAEMIAARGHTQTRWLSA